MLQKKRQKSVNEPRERKKTVFGPTTTNFIKPVHAYVSCIGKRMDYLEQKQKQTMYWSKSAKRLLYDEEKTLLLLLLFAMDEHNRRLLSTVNDIEEKKVKADDQSAS